MVRFMSNYMKYWVNTKSVLWLPWAKHIGLEHGENNPKKVSALARPGPSTPSPSYKQAHRFNDFFWHPSIRGLLDGARRAVSTCNTIHTVSESTDKTVADEKSLEVKGLGEKIVYLITEARTKNSISVTFRVVWWIINWKYLHIKLDVMSSIFY